MRLVILVLLAAAAAATVALLPDLAGAGVTGATTDLGLATRLGQGSVLAYGIAFAGGVLTSLTPCVYPLIPITVSIFGARKAGSRAQAMALSGLYVLGIAVMYSALGLGAAVSGAAFGTVMQSRWAVGFVALVFAAMGLSMFGLFELQLPSSWAVRLNRVGGAGYAGAFAMGLVSGIVAAPCTGPVLAAALAFIAHTGSVALGVSVMFAYALGLGLLFFLIGAFSLSLPKSGPWMEVVKSIFGVALLAAALALVLGVAPSLSTHFSPGRGALIAAAAVAAAGVLAGALTRSFSDRPTGAVLKAAGLVLVVGGIVWGVGAGRARVVGTAWEHDYEAAVRTARAEGRPMVIDFWADWCDACKLLDRTAWSDPDVQAESARFVRAKVDGTLDTPEFRELTTRYGVQGLPTVIFIDAQGREAPRRVLGAVPPAELLANLRAIDHVCDDHALPAKPQAAGAPEAVPPQGAPGDESHLACVARW
jgi:thiol:disulfide interchange protein DsbD